MHKDIFLCVIPAKIQSENIKNGGQACPVEWQVKHLNKYWHASACQVLLCKHKGCNRIVDVPWPTYYIRWLFRSWMLLACWWNRSRSLHWTISLSPELLLLKKLETDSIFKTNLFLTAFINSQVTTDNEGSIK